ncbi:sporulation protein YunB [Radiobacillus kanasensis]|uniref:sporulation protein YunB n=1 Tax=Radiobacillus kanasensis TaxID=2844358 RepID=UPI001E44BE91|nr:sporulation protein YunB [Radiobacillus kanasensis]UFT98237.1 sporulation protein YunB [Radiobacillus kanasensis]
MRGKFRFKRRLSPPPIKNIWVVTFIVFLIFTLGSFLIVNKGIKPIFLEIADNKTKQLANYAMGIAINKKLNDDLNLADYLEVETDENGNVVSYQMNTAVENRVQRNIQNRVENFLKLLEEGKVIGKEELPLDVEVDPESEKGQNMESVQSDPTLVEIPLGVITGIPLLANFGPKIPVDIRFIGFVSTEMETRIEGLNINNLYYESEVHIVVELETIIPFGTDSVMIEQTIPVGRGGVMGDVPEYYNSGGESGSGSGDLSIPIDPLQ